MQHLYKYFFFEKKKITICITKKGKIYAYSRIKSHTPPLVKIPATSFWFEHCYLISKAKYLNLFEKLTIKKNNY